MLFIAYFDESDTHGPAPRMIMSAFFGTARQWELFERKINALRRKYRFCILHAKDFRARVGEFDGWTINKCMRLVEDLMTAARDGLTEGVTTVLPHEWYTGAYREEPIPKRMRLDSQYGICFRICMYHLVSKLNDRKKKHRLNVVIENGHKNVMDTVRIFYELKADYCIQGIKILGDITVAKKSERLALMVADFLAHGSYLSEARVKLGQPGYFDMAAGDPPRRGEALLTQLEITPETLRGLKIAWQEAKDDRIAQWRAGRDARGTSSSQAGPR